MREIEIDIQLTNINVDTNISHNINYRLHHEALRGWTWEEFEWERETV